MLKIATTSFHFSSFSLRLKKSSEKMPLRRGKDEGEAPQKQISFKKQKKKETERIKLFALCV